MNCEVVVAVLTGLGRLFQVVACCYDGEYARSDILMDVSGESTINDRS